MAPGNPKALLYAGFAAAERGDRALARSRWQALKALHPPPQIEQMLDARIAELGPDTGAGAAMAGGVASGTKPLPVGTSPSPGALSEAEALSQSTLHPH